MPTLVTPGRRSAFGGRRGEPTARTADSVRNPPNTPDGGPGSAKAVDRRSPPAYGDDGVRSSRADPVASNRADLAASRGSRTTVNTLPVRLDPLSQDMHGQNAELRALGPVVRVELPGGVTAWSITRQALLRDLLSDPRIAANARHWRALAEGEVPDGWPMMSFVTVRSLTTADGADHKRLRGLVAQALTPRRVNALRPSIERTVHELLDGVADTLAANGSADLRALFAYPLPMTVVCDMLGFPVALRDAFHRITVTTGSTVTTPDEEIANARAMWSVLDSFVAEHRKAPGDDLTTALSNAVTEDGDVLSEAELTGTLATVLVAGHATVSNLITNAVRALLTNPEQLALVTSGQQPWRSVIEEALRWDSPLGHFPMRYATEDIEIGDTVIPRGDPIILSFAAVGRDPEAHGEDAERFDITRPPAPHLTFGHGVHFCVGAPLARLEADIALPALFERFPHLALDTDAGTPRPEASIVANGVVSLPVTA
jgi:cytochrome P450